VNFLCIVSLIYYSGDQIKGD